MTGPPAAVVAPLLGAGFPFAGEWGPLLAILLLLALQAALAYRRGKVEPPPPGPSGRKRPAIPVPEAAREESGAQASRGVDGDVRSAAASLIVEELPPGEAEPVFGEARIAPPLPAEALRMPPRRMRAGPVSAAFLRRLRDPQGAREVFLGAEVLWNPPMALRDPDAGLR